MPGQLIGLHRNHWTINGILDLDGYGSGDIFYKIVTDIQVDEMISCLFHYSTFKQAIVRKMLKDLKVDRYKNEMASSFTSLPNSLIGENITV